MPVLPAPVLLSLVAEILAAKAGADAAAMRSGSRAGPASADLAAFVMTHVSKRSGGGGGVAGGGGRVHAALAQLMASVRVHAAACRDVARFGQALGVLGPLEELAAAGAGAGGRLTGEAAPHATTAAGSPSGGGQDAGTGADTAAEALLSPLPLPPASRRPRKVRLRSLPQDALLPTRLAGVVERLAAAPGVSSLLPWVAGGAFLGHLGRGQELGRPLADVQVRLSGDPEARRPRIVLPQLHRPVDSNPQRCSLHLHSPCTAVPSFFPFIPHAAPKGP
jgi:hypothetical protein